ncbi:MAG: hypothetical protein AB8B53_03230 [Flavobacteriales bacterium]
MKVKTILLITLFTALVFSQCKKEEPSPFPEIEFVSISATEVEEFSNQVEVVIGYYDVNGDLGTLDADDLTLKVKDARLEGEDFYHVPPLTPELQELEIEGTFNLQLNPLFLLGNGSMESTDFTIQLRDRAGNWSNQITTPLVIIRDTL